MAQTETIREFLVRLGVVSDEPALRKFEDGVNRASKSVMLLGAAVGTVATGVAIGVQRFAGNLEQLYFSAHRVGSTASNLEAFQRAAQNFGATAEEAQGSIEGLAQAIATNPAYEGLLRKWGIDPHGDITQVAVQLGKVFSQQPLFVAKQWADQLGISYHTLLAIRDLGFGGEFTKRQQQLGPGFTQAAKDAHRFEEEVRDLKTVLEGFGATVFDVLENKLHFSLKTVTEWLQTNGPRVAQELSDGIRQLWDWINNKLIPILKDWADKYRDLDDKTGGWLTKLIGILAVLKAFGGTEIIGGVLNLTAALIKLGAAITGLSGGASASGSLGLGALGALGVGGALAAGAIWSSEKVKDSRIKQYVDKLHAMAPALSSSAIAGIVANLFQESSLQPTLPGPGGHFGLAQWSKAYQAQFQKMYGSPLWRAGADQQLQFLLATMQQNPELWRQMTNPSITAHQAAMAMYSGYERPGPTDTTGARRAALADSISQQITINIDGANSPEATGTAVVSAIQRAFAGTQRDVLPAVQ